MLSNVVKISRDYVIKTIVLKFLALDTEKLMKPSVVGVHVTVDELGVLLLIVKMVIVKLVDQSGLLIHLIFHKC